MCFWYTTSLLLVYHFQLLKITSLDLKRTPQPLGALVGVPGGGQDGASLDVKRTPQPLVALVGVPGVSSASVAPGSTSLSSETGFDLAACGNGDHPIRVEWDGKERDFVDGFGLCSHMRWHPWNRGSKRPGHSVSLAVKTFNILEKAVLGALKDPRGTAFKLVTGKLTSSPFSSSVLEGCRENLVNLLHAPECCLAAD